MASLAVVQRADDRLVVALAADWDIEQAAPRFDPLVEAALAADTTAGTAVATVGFDAAALGSWDSSLLIFLRQGQAYCEGRGIAFDESGLPESVTSLLALASAVPEHRSSDAAARPSVVGRFGLLGLAAWDAFTEALTFTGEVALSFARLLRGRIPMQWRAFWVVVQANSSGALPIVSLIALLVGVIIAFLGVVVLARFNAGYYVSYLVGYGMLREMGALMTGVIMAGRTSAAFAGELGSMKIAEETDAYITLGIAPIDHLVLPRVLGIFVMMPLLVVYADAVGIMGGMVVAITLLDLTPTQFMGGLLSAVTLPDALLGVVKATTFGLIIGLAGCMKGLQTGTDASAVGRSATSAVVIGITLIVLANAVLDWLAALLHI